MGHDNPGSLVHVIELSTGSHLGQFRSPEMCTSLALQSGSDGFIVTGSTSGTVYVWEVLGTGGLCRPRCTLKGEHVTCIAIACSGNIICTGSKENKVHLWRRRGDGDRFTFAMDSAAISHDTRTLGKGSISCHSSHLAFVQGPRSGSWEQGASLWNLALGSWERSFYRRGHSVECVALCDDMLATSSGPPAQAAVQLWHAGTGASLAAIEVPATRCWQSSPLLFLAQLEDEVDE